MERQLASAPERKKENRVYLRVTSKEKEFISEAAEMAYKDVTAFVRDAALARAEEVVTNYQATAVPSEFFDLLLRRLEEQPDVIPALARAADRARELGR